MTHQDAIPERPHPIRVEFHGALDAIDDQFVRAALDVADALPHLTSAFLAGDLSAIEEAKRLAIRTGELCDGVEDDGFVLLAREAPVAGDLRRLVALLRLTTDVSRSASLLKHVCMTLERFDPRELDAGLRQQLSELADRSTDVFRQGVDAWRRKDPDAVESIDEADEAVDELQQSLLERAASLSAQGDELLVLGLIARYYERIADHGVAIAQDATFVATGRRVHVGKKRKELDEGAG